MAPPLKITLPDNRKQKKATIREADCSTFGAIQNIDFNKQENYFLNSRFTTQPSGKAQGKKTRPTPRTFSKKNLNWGAVKIGLIKKSPPPLKKKIF